MMEMEGMNGTAGRSKVSEAVHEQILLQNVVYPQEYTT